MTTLEALNKLMEDKFLTERRIVDFISKEIEGFENRNGNIVAGARFTVSKRKPFDNVETEIVEYDAEIKIKL